MAKNKEKVCETCKQEYDIQETKRVFGDMMWILHYCSAQCFTKAMTEEKQ
jgi:hypothetical protein